MNIFTPPTAFIKQNLLFLNTKLNDVYLIPLENQFSLAYHAFKIQEFLYLLEKELEDKRKTGFVECYLRHPVNKTPKELFSA
ncbi:hypothetical protein CEE45_12285 [Candidatus Heimdallarchaeota archaeon B3_Heim]|nr:MAG: hypothetical protein CEE45_12285 [Candidatus Heimdallarchaeota archaeon B3_Heim]